MKTIPILESEREQESLPSPDGRYAWLGPGFLLTLSALAAASVTLACPPARAQVLHSKESALRLAFPSADHVQPRTFFLTEEQKTAVERRAGGSIDSRMITCYVGTHGTDLLGYAFFETHVVRTLPATFMVVLDPSGRIRAVHILAFHEPSDYLPPERWLRQFAGRHLGRTLAVGQDIVGIAGSSLSSQAVTAGVRRVLALYELLLRRPE